MSDKKAPTIIVISHGMFTDHEIAFLLGFLPMRGRQKPA
jgi:hypothetical protein